MARLPFRATTPLITLTVTAGVFKTLLAVGRTGLNVDSPQEYTGWGVGTARATGQDAPGYECELYQADDTGTFNADTPVFSDSRLGSVFPVTMVSRNNYSVEPGVNTILDGFEIDRRSGFFLQGSWRVGGSGQAAFQLLGIRILTDSAANNNGRAMMRGEL